MRYFPLLSFLIAFAACQEHNESVVVDRAPYIIPDTLLKTITMDTVRDGELINAITLTGQVDFNQDKQVTLFPLVSGNVEDVKVQLGDYVTAGQPLAIIRSSEMAGYSNNLVQAETSLTAAKKQLDAAQDLFKSGLSSSLDLTTAQTNYDQAAAQLEMVRRVLKINGNNTQGSYEVKAPINGFLVQKTVTNAQAIRTDNGNPMFVISDLKNVWIWANVYESNIDKISMGDIVDVRTLTYPDRVFHGKVDKIMHVLDPNSRVTKVRIVIDNTDYALRPLMFASVTVSNTKHQQALYVPKTALIFDNSRYYVLVYHGAGKADITPVETTGSFGDKVYIKSGVTTGEQVITKDAMQIYDQLNN
ncbi:MAG: efflux RND transporter periplasmic adaptor subunit [Ilumatobacteraceae bacterium]